MVTSSMIWKTSEIVMKCGTLWKWNENILNWAKAIDG